MLDHLAPTDASFLYLEDRATTMNAGTVLVLEPGPEGFDEADLARLVASVLPEVPRYRQRVRELPFNVAGPVWVDDAAFDLHRHVRSVALPAPGTDQQLAEFAARTLGRPLDRRHPLWQVYLVTGMAEGRVAVVTTTHQAIVDGRRSVDIAHLLLRSEQWHAAGPAEPAEVTDPADLTRFPGFRAAEEPGDMELLLEAGREYIETPAALARAFTGGARGVVSGAARLGGGAAGVLFSLARTTTDPAPESPLNARIGDSRRLSLVRTELEDYRLVRDAASRQQARHVTVNDVILTVVTGAVRAWLLNRGEPVHSRTRLKALVPVSVGTADEMATTGMADRALSCLVDLPVGEPDVLIRLRSVAHDMRRQVGGNRVLGADALAELAGFAPPTLHHMGVRLADAASRRVFNLIVSNAPGPQHPLYVGHARVVATYPVTPLSAGQALSVSVTSYDGAVFYGLNGDRTVMADIEQLAGFVPEALTELITEVTS